MLASSSLHGPCFQSESASKPEARQEPIADVTPRQLFASPDVNMSELSDKEHQGETPQTVPEPGYQSKANHEDHKKQPKLTDAKATHKKQETPADLPQTEPTKQEKKPADFPQTKPTDEKHKKHTDLPQTEQEKPAVLPQTKPTDEKHEKHADLPQTEQEKPADESDDDADAVAPEKEPPPQLSKGAMDKRLRRVMAPRVDGSYQVPEAVILQWKNKDSKKDVELLFEKSAYDPEPRPNAVLR